MARCELTGKGPVVKNLVSHSNIKTKSTANANIQGTTCGPACCCGSLSYGQMMSVRLGRPQQTQDPSPAVSKDYSPM